jgi:hypothetical protein
MALGFTKAPFINSILQVRRRCMKGKHIVFVFMLAAGLVGWAISPAFGDV